MKPPILCRYCELPTDPVQRTFVSNFCDAKNNSIFEANLGVLGPLNAMPLINATLQAAKPGVCAQNATCGLVASGDTWQYVDTATSAPFPEGILTMNGEFDANGGGKVRWNDLVGKLFAFWEVREMTRLRIVQIALNCPHSPA
jgi:hypothetical protein